MRFFGLQLDQIVKKVDGVERRFTVEKAGKTMHIDFVFKETKNPES